MKISLIAAIGKNRELGKDNKLLWHIPEDLKRFKEITKGHPVIMGRKTFESIGKPLQNRTNIIVTRDSSFARGRLVKLNEKLVVIVNSLEEAIETARNVILKAKPKNLKRSKILDGVYTERSRRVQDDMKEDEIFVIGGGQIYNQSIKFADKLYLTIVEARLAEDGKSRQGQFEADTFFPDYSEFKKIVFEQKRESNIYKYTFLELEK